MSIKYNFPPPAHLIPPPVMICFLHAAPLVCINFHIPPPPDPPILVFFSSALSSINAKPFLTMVTVARNLVCAKAAPPSHQCCFHIQHRQTCICRTACIHSGFCICVCLCVWEGFWLKDKRSCNCCGCYQRSEADIRIAAETACRVSIAAEGR